MENEKKEQKKEGKIKKFLKDNKEIVILTIIGAFGLTIGLKAHHREKMKLKKEGEEILKVLKTSKGGRLEPWANAIDEEVFTDLAPEIESMILNVGLEKGWIERSYSLDPVTHKLVEISIETIHGD